jgi:hypothetical protein
MFRYSIRELLLVIVVAGIGAGWWLDRNQLIAVSSDVKREAFMLRAYLERNGAKVEVKGATVVVADDEKRSVFVLPSLQSP